MGYSCLLLLADGDDIYDALIATATAITPFANSVVN